MKKYRAVLLLLIVGALTVAGCRSRTDRSEGTVVLSVSRFNGLPSSISLNDELTATDRVPFSIGTISLRSTVKEPGQSPASPGLQDIELRSYEVTYRRRDTGTRTPPPIVQGIFGIVSANQSADFFNLTYLLSKIGRAH